MLLLLLRLCLLIVVGICAWSSAHLRVGVGVGCRHVYWRRDRGGSWRRCVRLGRKMSGGGHARARLSMRRGKMFKREVEQRPREVLRVLHFTDSVLAP